MRQWMYNLYYEKEDMLAKYYQTGVFPHDFHNKETSRPRQVDTMFMFFEVFSPHLTRVFFQVVHDPIRFFLLHLFFMASSVVLWKTSMAVRAGLATAILL